MDSVMQILCRKKINGLRLAKAFGAGKDMLNKISEKWDARIPRKSWQIILKLGYEKAYDELSKLKHFEMLTSKAVTDESTMSTVSRLLDSMLEKLILKVKLEESRMSHKGRCSKYAEATLGI